MQNSIGVILLNMGGPDSPEAVEPFLYKLFSDRSIIRLGPWFLQKPIARFIAKRRAPHSKELYNLIGGSTPLLEITNKQAKGLEKLLQEEAGEKTNFHVTTAMRYCAPTAAEAVTSLIAKNVGSIIALPLYPQYSRATAGSSLKDLKKAVKTYAPCLPLVEIHGWPTQKSYVRCFAEHILDGIRCFDDASEKNLAVVYSAHSLPISFIEQGDPYLDHLKKSIKEIEAITKHTGHLCFQSRSGPVEWLSPSTDEMIDELAEKGYQNMLIVPISFVSDHVETLYEIDMLYRGKAEEKGITCRTCRSLNTSPLFLRALKELVLEHVPWFFAK